MQVIKRPSRFRRCMSPVVIAPWTVWLVWAAVGSTARPAAADPEQPMAQAPAGPADVDSATIAPLRRDSMVIGTGPWPVRPVTNWAFGAGESLVYSIGWEKIVAGRGEIVVGDAVDTLGRLCYPIVSTVRSTPFFSTFYRVDDRVSTLIDARELFPLRFEKHLSEGRYRQNRVVDFDPLRGVARTPSDTFAVPPYVLDDLSLLYYVRTMTITPGKDVEMDIYSGKKLYRLVVRILRKERIEVAAGTFSTVVVEPLLQAAGLFKYEGKVTVWLTDDRLHLPVLMKSKVVVGSIVAELEGYRLGQIRRY